MFSSENKYLYFIIIIYSQLHHIQCNTDNMQINYITVVFV